MGERSIVLDLAGVLQIDAAGVGELVRVYRMALAANGTCRVVHPTAWVREVLERVGLFPLLTHVDDDFVDTASQCGRGPRQRHNPSVAPAADLAHAAAANGLQFQSARGTRTC